MKVNQFYEVKDSDLVAYVIAEREDGNFAVSLISEDSDVEFAAFDAKKIEVRPTSEKHPRRELGKQTKLGVDEVTTKEESDPKSYKLTVNGKEIEGPVKPKDLYNSMQVYLVVPNEEDPKEPKLYRSYVYKENQAVELARCGLLFNSEEDAQALIDALLGGKFNDSGLLIESLAINKNNGGWSNQTITRNIDIKKWGYAAYMSSAYRDSMKFSDFKYVVVTSFGEVLLTEKLPMFKAQYCNWDYATTGKKIMVCTIYVKNQGVQTMKVQELAWKISEVPKDFVMKSKMLLEAPAREAKKASIVRQHEMDRYGSRRVLDKNGDYRGSSRWIRSDSTGKW